MHDAVIVQILDPFNDAAEPPQRLIRREPRGAVVQNVLQALARNVLHHDPGAALVVVANIVEVDQIVVLEIQTLPHAAELDIQIALNAFSTPTSLPASLVAK